MGMKPIEITIENERATAHSPFPSAFILLVSGLSGRKIWNGSISVTFDASGYNMKKLNDCELVFNIKDKGDTLKQIRALEQMATQHDAINEVKTAYVWRRNPFKHQKNAINISWSRAAYAWFLEMGLGKTAIAIANIGMLFKDKRLTGVLVLAPKGVHRQWVEEQVPEHMDSSIPVNGLVWNKREFEVKAMSKRQHLSIFALNIDAIRTPDGYNQAIAFLKLHTSKSMMIIDESHLIKNGTAIRTRRAWSLGQMATYRRILTGTPIARNILDAWSQFMFLDPKILGHKYIGTFKARYTISGGWENRQIIGQRNTEEFYRLIAPHAFRLTKAEALDLPPKIYATRQYEMGEVTAGHYKSLKKTFMTQLDNGDIVDVKNAAEAMLRLQQVVCGYLPLGDGKVEDISTERVDILMDIVEQIEGKVIIWARFTEDIRRIERALNNAGAGKVVTYYGATTTKARAAAKYDFTKQDARFFVSNPAAGGTGVDGLQICTNVIYYSNSFDALHRWQSEDRTHRMGTKESVNYWDIVARGTVDKSITANLTKKRSISDLTLDQIRQAIEASE